MTKKKEIKEPVEETNTIIPETMSADEPLDNFIVNKEVEEPVTEPTVTQELSQEELSTPVQEQDITEEKNSPQKSWKELREKAERAEKAERERDEALKILKAIEEEAIKYQQAQKQQLPQEEEINYDSISDDDLVEGKMLKKILSKEVHRIKQIEENMREQQRKTQEQMIENNLKSKYNDLFDVITPENIERLRQAKPSLAKALAANPDMQEKAETTYMLIKELGIYQPDVYGQDREVAQRNSSKPRTLSSVGAQQGANPLQQANAFANGLTDELKKKLYEEMKAKARGY